MPPGACGTRTASWLAWLSRMISARATSAVASADPGATPAKASMTCAPGCAVSGVAVSGVIINVSIHNDRRAAPHAAVAEGVEEQRSRPAGSRALVASLLNYVNLA